MRMCTHTHTYTCIVYTQLNSDDFFLLFEWKSIQVQKQIKKIKKINTKNNKFTDNWKI